MATPADAYHEDNGSTVMKWWTHEPNSGIDVVPESEVDRTRMGDSYDTEREALVAAICWCQAQADAAMRQRDASIRRQHALELRLKGLK